MALPLLAPTYFMHLAIQILLWGFIYTAWALMGRFGFVSLGHGAFLGIGAYVPALLWNYYALTPWIGIPIGVLLSALLAVIIGYPCFRLKVVGHYFALVTLALGQVVLLFIVAERDITGGSLGMTQKSAGHSWYAFQFPDKTHFYFIALVVWLAGLADLAQHRPRHRARSAGGDLRGRGSRGLDGDRRAVREDAHHRHQRRADRVRRRPVRPVSAVPQSRDDVGHRRVAADRVRRDRRAACIPCSARRSARCSRWR